MDSSLEDWERQTHSEWCNALEKLGELSAEEGCFGGDATYAGEDWSQQRSEGTNHLDQQNIPHRRSELQRAEGLPI